MARVITPAPTWSAPSALFHKVYKESRDYAISCARVEIADKMIAMGYSRAAIYASLYPMWPGSNAHWYRRDRERIAKARAESRRNAKIRRLQREYLRSTDWEAAA